MQRDPFLKLDAKPIQCSLSVLNRHVSFLADIPQCQSSPHLAATQNWSHRRDHSVWLVLIAKLAISPPVEETVKPVAAVLTVLVSEDDERVKAGAASGAVVEVGVGSWVGFGFPQSAGRLATASIKFDSGR